MARSCHFNDIVCCLTNISLRLYKSIVICILVNYRTMLMFTEFAAKSNGFRPHQDLTFALNMGYVVKRCPLIIEAVVQSVT